MRGCLRDGSVVTTSVQLRKRETVVDVPLSHGRFYGLRAATPSLIALTGSFRITDAVDHREQILPKLVAALLTCGSQQRDEFAIADVLESRGASLSVESEFRRVTFSARACTADLPVVVELLSECLREPRFDAGTFATEKARLIAELQYRATDPTALAEDALSRTLYPSQHPRYQISFAEQILQVEKLTVDDVRRYHRQQFAANDLRIVAVGDIDPLLTAAEIDRHLAAWSPRLGQTSNETGVLPNVPKVIESETFDILLGHRLAIHGDHPDYLALWMASHVLGGSFTSRLVTAVREEQGLSYSIYSMLTKPEREFDGHWQIGLSLSPENLDAGLAATRAEISCFVEGGVTASELAAKQLEAIGVFHISLATLSGLSETILFGVERGWGPDFICEFTDSVRAITAAQLNGAVGEHFHPGELHTVIAGPFAGIDSSQV
jgi:zinc protease